MDKIRSILFVCTGNSCRSIMAEALMMDALKEIGKDDIKISSAGVSAIDGFSPTRETIEVMKREGVDVIGFKSRSLTDDIIKSSDLILVMTAGHKEDVIEKVPEAASKTHMLKEYGKHCSSCACGDLDIRDPIGNTKEVYEEILNEIKKEVQRIAKIL